MSEIKTFEATLPIYIASYLINSDDSGITKEERKEVDDYIEHVMERLEAGYIDCVDVGESHFSRQNDLNFLGGDVAEFTFLYKLA